MNIKHNSEQKGGTFFAEEDGVTIGEMTYIWGGERMIIDHTFVLGSRRGEGIAEKLVRAAVDFARANNFTISPLCPYVVAEFRRRPEYADIHS